MARATTVRVNISDIVQAKFDPQGPRYVSPLGVEMRRVMLVGHVIRSFQSKKEREFAAILLDDGTDTIQVKAWDSDMRRLNLVRGVEVGSLVLVIGKIRQSGQQDLYIEPEIIRRLTDPNYITLHILERLRGLLTLSGVSSQEQAISDDASAKSVTTRITPTSAAKRTSTDNGSSELVPSSAKSDASEGRSTTLKSKILEFIKTRAAQRPDGRGVDGKEIIAFFVAKGSTNADVNLCIIDLLDEQKIREVSVSRYLPCDV